MADMQEYLNEAATLASDGKHAEALERFLWFHEHALEHDEGMAGVRLSFALGYWYELSESYPPARTAMQEVLDRTVQQLRNDGGTFELFQDASALNHVLGSDDETVELFESIVAAHPNRADRYWIVAKDHVIAAGRFDLVERHMGQIDEEFGRLRETYEHLVTFVNESDDRELAANIKQFNESNFVESVQQLMAIGIQLGKPEQAQSVQREALAVLDHPEIRAAFSGEAEGPAVE